MVQEVNIGANSPGKPAFGHWSVTGQLSSNSLSVSIVVFRSEPQILRATVTSLLTSIATARQQGCLADAGIDLVHNGEETTDFTALAQSLVELALASQVPLQVIEGHGNVGYGRGHNLSITQADSSFHLILNPDVMLSPECLVQGLEFLKSAPTVAALSPAVQDGQGHKQYVCKRFPTVLDFLLRGFAPEVVKGWFRKRLAWYEMQDLPETSPCLNVPIISGCFMLFCTPVLQSVGGFDERYFLYFEDFDLSLRVHDLGLLAYLPNMHIVHLGGNSARKGLRHIGMFIRSGLRFYNTHGWRLL